jgi:tetratricopeptide (TPR) repeat protein
MNRKHRRMQGRKSKRAAGRRGPSHLGAQMEAAIADHESGRLDEAERAYRSILATARNPDALHLLGVLQHQRGQIEEAIATIGEAAALAPDQAAYHYNLAEAYRVAGRLAEAIERYRRAIALEPRIADAHFNLGNALFEQGDILAAARSYRRARKLAPEDAEIALNLGNALIELGDPEEALALFQAAAARTPDNPGAQVNIGTALVALGRLAEGLRAYRAAADAHEVNNTDGRETEKDETEIHFAIGSALVNQGQSQAALEFLEPAAACAPGSAPRQALLARALQENGRFDAAIAGFERALAIDPAFAAAHHGIAGSRKFATDDPALAQLTQTLDDPSLDPETRASLLFSLAKMRDDLGETDAAFAACAEANSLKRRFVPYSAAAFSQAIDALIALFTEEFFNNRKDFGAVSERPVFILGMPRSGTTLVEQVLASHGQVAAGGERSEIRNTILGLPMRLGAGGEPFPRSVAAMDRALSRALGGLIDGIFENLAPEAARFTDKMPNNFVRLAFIALVLPNARVIHCRRDAMDTCLSCFFQDFDRRQEFSYDLADLGAYYCDYVRLMAHWRAVLPLRMLEVDYEALTADQEAESRRMVEFCGLDWDPRCLAPHKASGTVRTASLWQARQPVYRSSVERWRRYEAHLGPLKEALETGAT